MLFAKEKRNNKGRTKYGTNKKIHDSVIEELQIKDKKFKVKQETIRSRVKRQSLTVNPSNNQHTPVQEIEPVLLKFATWKQEAGQPITPSEG